MKEGKWERKKEIKEKEGKKYENSRWDFLESWDSETIN